MKRKIALCSTIASLVALIVIGSTLAFLTYSSETISGNIIVGNPNLAIQFVGSSADNTDAFLPGSKLSIDSALLSTSGIPTYVAVKVSYTKEGKPCALSDIAEIADIVFAGEPGQGWSIAENGVAFCQTALLQNQTTEPLISQIKIKEVDADALFEFHISLTAYAVAAEDVGTCEQEILAYYPHLAP